MSLRVENFGCRLNALEGDSVAALAKAAGLEKTTIINGCAVTQEALRQARQAVRKAKRDGQAVIVTGCAAQTDAENFAAMPEVDRVLGNEEKLQAASYRQSEAEKGERGGQAVGDIMQKTVASPLPKAPQSTARARFRASANRLRPSLHILHNSLWARQFALRAGRRCGRALSRFAGRRA